MPSQLADTQQTHEADEAVAAGHAQALGGGGAVQAEQLAGVYATLLPMWRSASRDPGWGGENERL